ncbi:cysteine--tRNA ligase [Candidatus Berkelbacteria bacterium]|nr:cysteine--tRNA ligase [Candidatus Berkelbacteria bacterium]
MTKTTDLTTKNNSSQLRFYNYRTRSVDPFVPTSDVVGLYTCGPTVYNTTHIGNLRTYLFEDFLRRTLRYFGLTVRQVMNLTDVEDKIIRAAAAAQVSIQDFTEPFVERFFADLAALNIQPAETYPRATEHIPDMIHVIEQLLKKGFAYAVDGSVYFSIRKFPAYGQLAGIVLDQLKPGARVDQDEYDKEAAEDFALWKAAKPADEQVQAVWDSPWGRGRPGWHIECSAMSMKYLGSTFDLHTGGVDNIFPHHEDEIAQSEGATGQPFAQFFLEGEHLLVDGQKMAKSLNNFYGLSDLVEKGIEPLAFRYLICQTHYRSRLNFTWESVGAAGQALQAIRRLQYQPAMVPKEELIRELNELVAHDLNIPGLIARLHQEQNPLLWAHYEPVLGIGFAHQPGAYLKQFPEGKKLLAARETARGAGNFAESDRIRETFRAQGWLIDDTPSGPVIYPVNLSIT